MQIPKPFSPPCPVSRRQRVRPLQTNSRLKTARRNDKGVYELRRFPPIRPGRAVEGLPLLSLKSDVLARALIKQLLCAGVLGLVVI